jgi:hypothetical protein
MKNRIYSAQLTFLALSSTILGEAFAQSDVGTWNLRSYARAMGQTPPVLAPARKEEPAAEYCKRVSESQPSTELVALKPNAGLLWPGNLIQYSSLGAIRVE